MKNTKLEEITKYNNIKVQKADDEYYIHVDNLEADMVVDKKGLKSIRIRNNIDRADVQFLKDLLFDISIWWTDED